MALASLPDTLDNLSQLKILRKNLGNQMEFYSEAK